MNQQQYQPRDDQFSFEQDYHRKKPKKKRSLMSMLLNIIALILTGILTYSMYKEPLFDLKIIKQQIGFQQLSTLTTNLQGQQFFDFSELIQNIEILKTVLIGFFILAAISLILTILTIIFNKMVLKFINLVFVIFLILIPAGLMIMVNQIATNFESKLSQFNLGVKADEVISHSDALMNALILSICTFVLIFISIFFRNKRK